MCHRNGLYDRGLRIRSEVELRAVRPQAEEPPSAVWQEDDIA